MPNHTFKNNTLYSLPSSKVLFCILLSVFSTLTFSKQISFDFSSEHGDFLLGHKTNEFRQYIDTNGGVKLTVTPKSTSSPHLQQCHKYNEPNDIYVHQDFSGLGVKYRPKHFWMPPFRDSGELDTYGGYTDRLSFEFSSAITGELVPVTVKNIRFKRFEPLLFWDNAYIQDGNSGDVINVSKHSIHKNLFRELFPSSFMERHTFGFWRFDTSLETNNFVITPGKFDSFKVYSITIEIGEQAPKIISTPPLNVIEGQKYEYQVVTASNGDFTYSLIQAPDGMAIDDSTGTVVWTPTFVQSGVYPVELTVTDKQGRLTNQTYNLSVENKNRAPVISSSAIKSAQENSLYQYTVTATDPDEDLPSFKLTSAPVGMVISAQGTISWQPSFDQAGVHEILVSVSDGSLTVGQAYSLAVQNVNQLPVLETIPAHSIREADDYLYEVRASDSDGDLLHYAFHFAPTGMFINTEGKITWLPNYQQAGSYAITVNVSDGDAVVQAKYVLIVENVNRSPVITSQPIVNAVESASYTYPIKAFDADGDSLSFELQLSPTGMAMTEDGTISWTPDFNQFGDHPVTVKVNDASSYIEHAFVVSVSNTNRAPAISSQPTLLASENASYQYAVSATDDDLDKISYKLVTFPVGMGISPTGVVSWLPTYDQEGTHAVSLQVSDSEAAATQTFDIEVINTNRMPVVTSSAILSAKENSTYQYQIQAIDVDEELLTYELTQAPAGMVLDAIGNVSWTPTFEQSGTYIISITVNDGTDFVNQEFSLVVDNTNRAPVFSSSANLTARENIAYGYDPVASDPDGDALVYSLVTAPIGMFIEHNSQINWTPTFEQAGEHQVVLSVSDQDLISEQAFTIIVENVNRPPSIGPVKDFNINENDSFDFQLDASDDDFDALTFTLAEAPIGMLISKSGLINWMPSFDQAGAHSVTVEVSDAQSNVTASFVINVSDTNRLPAINSFPLLTINESESYQYQILASDEDLNPLTFSLVSSPLGMSVNNSGMINWVPSFTQSGDHDIRVRVSDGTDAAEQNYTLSVINVNRAPVFTSVALTNVIEKEIYQYTAVASDPDGDALQYNLVIAPSEMSIDASTGIVNWETTADSIGSHYIVISAVDSFFRQVEQGFTLTVLNVNDSPVITSVPVTIGTENLLYEYQVVATDEDGNALTYIAHSMPVGMSIDADSGLVSWLPNFNQAGAYALSVEVSDNHGLSVTQVYALQISNENRRPSITSTAETTVEINDEYVYQVLATDPDSEPVKFELTVAPAGMVIDENTGLISWVPSNSQLGEFNVEINALDPHLEFASQSFIVQVTSSNQTPEVLSQPMLSAIVDQGYRYSINAIDAEQDPLTFEILQAPEFLKISTEGVLSGLPASNHIGMAEVSIGISDGINSVIHSYTLNTVQLVETDPVNWGKDFWFVDALSRWDAFSSESELRIIITSKVDTQGVIESPLIASKVPQEFSVAANQVITIDYPSIKKFFDHDLISNRSIHISADDNISVYVLLYNEHNTDATSLIPTDALGYNYRLSGYRVSANSLGEYAMVATQDNTELIITPAEQTRRLGGGFALKGEPYTVILNKGDVYSLRSEGQFSQDLTGTSIKSNEPISVFTLHSCSNVPTTDKYCDRLTEQLPSIEQWGYRHAIVPLYSRYGDLVRVLANKNNTRILIDGVESKLLQAGEFWEYMLHEPQWVSSSEPVLITQFSTSDTNDKEQREQDENHALTLWHKPWGVITSQILDDSDNYQTEYIVNIDASNKNNSIILVVPDDQRAAILVDGVPLSENLFPNRDCGSTCGYAPYNLNYAIGQVALSVGEHTINSTVPFGVYENIHSLSRMADPFMAVVPPIELSQDTYIFTTPATEYARHFINITLPTDSIDSLRIDGEAVDSGYFAELSNQGFSYARLAINAGRHEIRADKNFSLLVYGFDSQDSYGFIGGYGYSSPLMAENLSLSANTLEPIAGDNFCVNAQITDAQYEPLEDVTVRFSSTGVHTNFGTVFTEANGVAEFCYLGYLVGADEILVEIDGLSKNMPINWQVSQGESKAPVITSIPVTYVIAQHNYEYAVQAIDPEGDVLTYSLKESPVGMTIDPSSGLIDWVAIAGTYQILVEVNDPHGNVSQQLFLLVANSLPVILEYPANPVDNRANYRSGYTIEDPDGDAVFCQFLSSTDHWFHMIEDTCQISYGFDMPTGDFPLTVKISDGRGGEVVHSFVLHVVQNHSPVITNTEMNVYGNINETMSFTVQAEDANDDPLSLRIWSAKLNGNYFDSKKLVLDSENLSVQWTPVGDEFGTLEVSLVVDHQFWGSAQKSMFFHVENRDFTITSLPTGNARVGVEYQYAISVDDPDNQIMNYSLLDSPVGMTIDENGLVSWAPTELQEGFTPVSVQVSDGENIHGQEFELSVQSLSTQMTTQLHTDKRVVESEEVINVSGGYLNSLGQATETLFLDGNQVVMDENGKAQITINDSGVHLVVYTVKDDVEEVSKSLKIYVKDPNDITPAIATLITPTQGDQIFTALDVIATVTDEQLIYWQLLLQKGNRGNAKILAEGDTEIAVSSIASIDPTMMMNGLYTLTLVAVDLGGNESFSQVIFPIDGNLKVGNMSFTVEDLSIPVAGVPISVRRTYDSRRRDEALDFGHGWSIDYQNIQVDESLEPTQGWYQYQSNSRFVSGSSSFNSKSYCIAPIGEKQVSVTLPDGSVERFITTAKAVDGGLESSSHPGCYFTSGRYYDIEFIPEGNTRSTLELGEHNTHSFYLTNFTNGDFVADIIEGSYTPIDQYQLTTQSGYVYHLDQNFGIKTITDPNGNILTYSSHGITHSSGKSILFNRDDSGRINSIVNPAGETVMEYQYGGAGNLRFAKDFLAMAEGNKGVEYTYNLDHNIIDIIDPLGRNLVKNLYDDDGRLTGQEDADGNVKLFDHNINAGTSLVTDLDGRSTLFNYDDKGNVTQEVKVIADSSYDTDIVSTFEYDANDNQISKTIGSIEYSWLSTFDDDSNQLSATDPQGQLVQFRNYNARGQEGSIVDELGRETGMQYDGAGNLTQITMPELSDPDTGAQQSLVASNVINLKGQITQSTDLRGLVTAYTYYSSTHDSADQKRTEHNEISGTVTYTYDANNNLSSESRERSVGGEVITEVVVYEYDQRDRLIKTIYPDTSFIQTEYDLAGNVSRERDRFGVWTDFDYDGYGRLLKTVYADGNVETRQYSAEGLLESITDVSSHTTKYEYDDAGRLWKTVFADNSYIETNYTPQGWVKSEKDTLGNITEYEYDLAGKRTGVLRFIEGEGGAVETRHSFTYYKNGELKSETNANGYTTTYEINEFDQRVQTSFQDGTVTGQRFDAMGARLKLIDQNNSATHFGYDDLGRLNLVQPQVQINGEDVPETSYTFDEQGNKLTQTDALNRTTSWSYDYFGRVLRRTLPEGMSETFTYDDSNKAVTHTDFNGDSTVTVNDDMGRIRTITYSNSSVESFSYWPNGQIKTATVINNQGNEKVTSYRYDNRDRLVSEIQADGSELSYQYDFNGNRTQVKLAKGESGNQTVTTTDYGYDSLNRLERVTDSSGSTTYSYDDVGNQKTITYPNGLVTEYTYNEVNQLTNLTTKNANGDVVSSYSYELDNTGRRGAITESSGRYTGYRYDNMYRLIEEVIKQTVDAVVEDYSASYQYDWVGNRTYEIVDGVSTSYSYDLNDRLTSQGGTTYSYDDNGNTLTETLDSKVKTYSYDAKNKLIGVSTTESDVEVSSSAYSYNVNGIRDSKTEDGVTTSYVVDSNRDYAQVLEEIVNGTTIAQYSYGHDLLSQNRSDEFKFYLYDGLGSTRGLSNSAGVLTDTYDYEAFGEVLNETGTTDNNYKFTGEQFDASLDQYYLRARYYDQGVGRFTQQDTWMGRNYEPLTLNKYSYVTGDPVNFIDPSGMFGFAELMASLNVRTTTQFGAHSSFRATIKDFGTDMACVAVTDFVEDIVIEALTGGVYVLLDSDKKYVGMSNDMEKRFNQHVNNADRSVTRTLARFHMEPGRNQKRLLEQFFMDLLETLDPDKGTNKNRSIAEKPKSKNSKSLRAMLSKLDFCP